MLRIGLRGDWPPDFATNSEENVRFLWSRLQSSQSDHNTTNDDDKGQTRKHYTAKNNISARTIVLGPEQPSCTLPPLLATNHTSILLNILAGSKWGPTRKLWRFECLVFTRRFGVEWYEIEAFVFEGQWRDIGRMGWCIT
jgi:hypothetical protein